LGAEWLEEMENISKKGLKAYMGNSNGKGWKQIPDGWDMLSDHYSIARSMSNAEYAYLASLPLILHIPRLHTFIAHAGLLPMDPKLAMCSPRQPLSHIPTASKTARSNVTALRHLQEAALISDVSQNTEPWVIQNMRIILDDNAITKSSKKGRAWSNLWNEVVGQCKGFETPRSLPDLIGTSCKLSCFPSTVIYGHAAARGLDIKWWTKGLDSACVYGKRLTAMIISAKKNLRGDLDGIHTFYDHERLQARLVDVKC